MRLRHIEVFNAVMLTGSVSSAARLINVTQPAVSRTLAHAELQLGIRLFQRAKGRLVPTSEAQTLYPHIAKLFSQLDEVQRMAHTLRTGRREGELHILSVLALSHEILPRALTLFRERHPEVLVKIESLHSPQIVSALALQEADVGYVFSNIAHPALELQHLAQGRMVCIAPKGMLDDEVVARGVVSLAELAQTPAISLEVGDPLGISLSQACGEAGLALRSIIRVQSYHAALALAHHGLGVALVDACTAVSADRKRVEVLALEPAIAVPISALSPINRPGTLLATAMTRCVQQAVVQALGA